jgi:hypothetical protein
VATENLSPMAMTLIVGGTGMLADVARTLAARGDTVAVVARGRDRFREAFGAAGRGGTLHHVAVDYTDLPGFRAAIATAAATWGPPALVIARIRSDAPASFQTLVDTVDHVTGGSPWRLFHVRSSAASRDPTPPPVPDSCRYRQIILGFVLEATGARWLHHAEIVRETLTAIDHDRVYHVVGTVEPWDRRPSY